MGHFLLTLVFLSFVGSVPAYVRMDLSSLHGVSYSDTVGVGPLIRGRHVRPWTWPSDLTAAVPYMFRHTTAVTCTVLSYHHL